MITEMNGDVFYFDHDGVDLNATSWTDGPDLARSNKWADDFGLTSQLTAKGLRWAWERPRDLWKHNICYAYNMAHSTRHRIVQYKPNTSSDVDLVLVTKVNNKRDAR